MVTGYEASIVGRCVSIILDDGNGRRRERGELLASDRDGILLRVAPGLELYLFRRRLIALAVLPDATGPDPDIWRDLDL